MKRAWLASAVAAILFGVSIAGAGQLLSEQESGVPLPGPGSSARYSVTPLGADEDYGVEEIRLTWGDAEMVRDEFHNLRMAWPLHIEVQGTQFEHRLWTYYDVETGEALFDGQETVRPYKWQDTNFYGVSTGESSADLQLALELYEATRGLCGVNQGATIDAGAKEVWLTGHCGRLDAEPSVLFKRTSDLTFKSTEDPRFVNQYRGGIPFPIRMTVPLSDMLIWMGWTDVVWQLDLEEWQQAPTAFAPGPSLVELGKPPRQLPLTDHILDDSDLDHPFSLGAAVTQVLATQSDVADFVEGRNDAYLQSAWGRREEDGSGNHIYVWALAWSDGNDWVAKIVRQHPGGTQGVTSELLPPSYSYDDYEPDIAKRAKPMKAVLPATMPSPSDAMALFETYRGNSIEAFRYGFQFYCQDDCKSAGAIVAGGDYTADVFDRSNDPQANVKVMTEGYHYGYDQLMLIPDGRIAYQENSLSETAPVARNPLDSAPAPSKEEDAGFHWTAPTAGQAAGAGLLAIISGLLVYLAPGLKAPALALFSRIRGEHLLEHPARSSIMAIIEAEPGIHFQEMSRRLDMGRSTLQHHLHKLSEGHHIRAKVSPGYTCYFPRKMDRNRMAAAPFLRADGPRSILQEVVHGKDGRVSAISRKTGLSTSTVSHHLGRMKKAGLVEGGGRAGFRPTVRAAEAI